MTVTDLREAVALLDEARAKAADSKDRRRWSRRRWALRSRLREWEELPRRVAEAGGRTHTAREIVPEYIAETPKRKRSQLAKSELWLILAVVAEFSMPEYEVLDEIAAVYGLNADDMKRLCHQIGGELENRAMRAGYEDAWIF